MLIGNKCNDCGWCHTYYVYAQSFIETPPTFESTTDKLKLFHISYWFWKLNFILIILKSKVNLQTIFYIISMKHLQQKKIPCNISTQIEHLMNWLPIWSIAKRHLWKYSCQNICSIKSTANVWENEKNPSVFWRIFSTYIHRKNSSKKLIRLLSSLTTSAVSDRIKLFIF